MSENVMDGTCSTYEKREKKKKKMVGKQKNGALGEPGRMWEDDIKAERN
jgi:hypothetical protein